jgi:hypothetical protein
VPESLSDSPSNAVEDVEATSTPEPSSTNEAVPAAEPAKKAPARKTAAKKAPAKKAAPATKTTAAKAAPAKRTTAR